jgi:Transposase.
LTVAVPPGIFSNKPHQKTTAPVDLSDLREYTQRLWHNESDVLTVEEASHISDLSKNTIYKWIQRERLMSIRYMGRHIIPKEELIKALFDFR